MAVLPVIRSGFYEDRQKFTLCGPNVRHNFSPFLASKSSVFRMFVGVINYFMPMIRLVSYNMVVLETGRGWPPFDQERRL